MHAEKSVFGWHSLFTVYPILLASVAQSHGYLTGDQVVGLIPAGAGNILSWRTGDEHEILSTVSPFS